MVFKGIEVYRGVLIIWPMHPWHSPMEGPMEYIPCSRVSLYLTGTRLGGGELGMRACIENICFSLMVVCKCFSGFLSEN